MIYIIIQEGNNVQGFRKFEGTKEEAIEECRRRDTYNNYGYKRAILLEYKPLFEIGVEPVEKYFSND
jgi:hypothetical protein